MLSFGKRTVLSKTSESERKTSRGQTPEMTRWGAGSNGMEIKGKNKESDL